jgi:small subunit ribosomal protein S4
MGDPKNPRRVWKKPKRPLNYDLKMEELKTLGTFGLKTKRELWKAHTQLSNLRHQARSLLALRQEVREEKEPILMQSLAKVGLVEESSTLDDVLNLQVTDLLSRRLQTVVQKKFSFKTPYQARQAVVHGHIMIGDRIVNVPSYVVRTNEEKQVSLAPDSSLSTLVEQLKKSEAEQPPVEISESEPNKEGKVETAEQPPVEISESKPNKEGKVETTEQPKEQSPVEETKVENSSTK